MLSKTRNTPVDSAAPGAVPDALTEPASNGAPVASENAPARSPTPARGAPASAPGSGASERDERRQQRAMAREEDARTPPGATTDRRVRTGERLREAKTQLEGPSRRGRLALGETVSFGLIGIVLVGLVLGAILGALGAAGWVVGLLVATLTLVLSGVLRRSPRPR